MNRKCFGFQTDYKRIMCEKTKPETESIEKNEDAEVIKDQTERGYYYDDSCGYDIYIEDEQEET